MVGRLEEIQYTQQNEQITGPEEKKMIKEMEQLKAAMPLSEEHSKLDKKLKDLKTERRAVLDKMRPLFDKKKHRDELIKKSKARADKLKEQRKEQFGDLDKQKENKDKDKKRKPDDPFTETIEEKKKHRSEQYDRRKKLNEDYNTQREEWIEKTKELRKLQFKHKVKEAILRKAKDKDRRVAEAREREMEEVTRLEDQINAEVKHIMEISNQNLI